MAVRYNSQQFGYSRSVADRQRRRFLMGISLVGFFLLIVLGGIGYWIIGSDFFRIKEIKAEGIQKVDTNDVLSKIDELKRKKFLGIFTVDHNLAFFDQEKIRSEMMIAFPIFEEVQVTKDLPSRILISVKERNPRGVWCLGVDPEMECRYFDDSGSTWGNALRSTGTLLITVEDEMLSPEHKNIDIERVQMIKNIYEQVNALNINIRKILIPQNSLHELRVYTGQGYYIIFDTDRSLEDQFSAFKTFVTQRGNRDYEYIDLRIKDRVYYK